MSFIKRQTDGVFRAMQKSMPKISDTEQQALDAGTVWWEQNIFSGNPKKKDLTDIEMAMLTDEEKSFLDNETQELCKLLNMWDERKTHDLSPEAWAYIKEKRFLGMIIPKERGGLGFSALAHSAVVSKVSTASPSGAVSVMVPNSLGPAELLLKYGTNDQRGKYLTGLATGDHMPCFALTSPKAGSDAGGIPDKGIVCYGDYNGKETLGLRVTWDKRYITLAPIATLLGLAFKVQDPDNILGEGFDRGITLALIPADHEGVEIGTRHFPVNQCFMNGPTRGNDVFIPMEFIIGGEKNIGEGWKMLMNCLSEGRAVSLPALATGATKYVARYVGAYTRNRKQFGIELRKMEGIQEKLADIASEAYTLECARRFTCAALHAGEKPSVASAIMKYQSTERMRKVVNHGMDILGGKAIIEGPSNFLSQIYYSVPVSVTVEGANILTRTLMVYGQGAIRCHPFMLDYINAINDDDVDDFTATLVKHSKYAIGNTARAKFRSLFGYFSDDEFGALKRESAIFAVVSDILLLELGGTLKRNGILSGLMADALSELYMMSAMIHRKHHDDRGALDEVHMLAYQRSLCNFETAIVKILENFPIGWAGKAMKVMFFPLGRRNKEPSKRLMSDVATIMTNNSSAREALTEGIFITDDVNHPAGIQEATFKAICGGREGITQLVEKAIKVDEFDDLNNL